MANSFSFDIPEAINKVLENCKIVVVPKDSQLVQLKHGHWIWHGSYYTCSVCGEEQYGVDTGRFYCQNCGAKMDEID